MSKSFSERLIESLEPQPEKTAMRIVGDDSQRGKDMIILPSGKSVHPDDLEAHYLQCPLVSELAIIGIQDESDLRAGTERLAAVVVPHFEHLKRAKIANSKEAVRHSLDNLGRELPEYQRVPNYIIRAKPLPRTATNKIERSQLKKEVESGLIFPGAMEEKPLELTLADRALLATDLGKAVTAVIIKRASTSAFNRQAEVWTQNSIHPAMNLEIDLGLDSLARAETFTALEQALSTQFDGDEAATALTVGDVIELVNKHGGKTSENITFHLNWTKIIRETDDDLPEVLSVQDKRPFGIWIWLVFKTFNLFCKIFMRLEVRGVGNLSDGTLPGKRAQGARVPGFLICPNHQSYLDPFVLCSIYPFHLFKNVLHFGASEIFDNSIIGFFARMLKIIPVNPDTELMRAMKAGAVGLKHGKVLNIYPEGERAFDGELHTFKKGAAILATELDLPIVPVAIDGLYKVWPRKSWRIRPAKVKITIGTPFYPRDVVVENTAAMSEPGAVATGLPSSPDAHYEAVTNHLKQTIAKMLNEMRTKAEPPA